MAPRATGAAFGLLAFSTTVFTGLWVRNPITTTLTRALWAMLVFALIGLILGAAARTVVREHVGRRKKTAPPSLQDGASWGEKQGSVADRKSSTAMPP